MDRIRIATAADAAQLLHLWALLSDEDATDSPTKWEQHAHKWFTRCVEDRM